MYHCVVCHWPIANGDVVHTYHAFGCPARHGEAECTQLSQCGEDCHEACCPTCNIVNKREYYTCGQCGWVQRDGEQMPHAEDCPCGLLDIDGGQIDEHLIFYPSLEAP